MFPSVRQRTIISISILLSALIWQLAIHNLSNPLGLEGISLLNAQSGFFFAILIAAIVGLPSILLGLITSATGNPLTGIFTAAGSLLIIAYQGGKIDGYLLSTTWPGNYQALMFEMLIWQCGLTAMIWLITKVRSPLHSKWPALAFDDHLGVDTKIQWPDFNAIAAGLTCSVVAFVLAWLFIHNSDTKQVIGSLIVAFTLGSLAGQIIFPQKNPVAILYSPALVAIIAYGFTLYQFKDSNELLTSWFARSDTHLSVWKHLSGPALALPIHFISAGVLGCTLGIGLAQNIEAAHLQALDDQD